MLTAGSERLSVLIPRFGIEAVLQVDHIKKALEAANTTSDDKVESEFIVEKHLLVLWCGGEEVLHLQVFQQIEVRIEVRGGSGVDRRLVVLLMHGGRVLDGG